MFWMLCLMRLGIFGERVARSGFFEAWQATWYDLLVGMVGVGGIVWSATGPLFGPKMQEQVKESWAGGPGVYFFWGLCWLLFALLSSAGDARWPFWLNLALGVGCIGYAALQVGRNLRAGGIPRA